MVAHIGMSRLAGAVPDTETSYQCVDESVGENG